MKSVSEVVKLLKNIPYFLIEGRLIPPRSILNELLRRGVDDAGMSGYVEWQPFEVGEVEYAALVEELQRRGMKQPHTAPPEDVDTYSRWIEWGLVYRMGDDEAADHLAALFEMRRKLTEQIEASEDPEDEDALRAAWLARIDFDARISRILTNWHERLRARGEADEAGPARYFSPAAPGAAPTGGKIRLVATIGNPETEAWEDPAEIHLVRQSEFLSSKYPALPRFIREDTHLQFVAENHELAIHAGLSAFVTAHYAEAGNSLFLMVQIGGKSVVQVRSPAFYDDGADTGFSVIFNVPGGDFAVDLLLTR